MIGTKYNRPQGLTRSDLSQDSAQVMDLHLMEVPTPVFSSHRAAQARGVWRGLFDVAVWLRTPIGVLQPLQLVLKYRDDSGEQQLLIDSCHSGSHKTILLNASLPIPINGRLLRAGLYLKSVDRGIVISLEEWHLIPQERQGKRRR